MSELTGYGPGFPVGRVETITKRELFAAMAMQGLLASQIHGMPNMPSKLPFAAIALDAADALIAALAVVRAHDRDGERYRYWRENHGWTGYFDDGASNSDDPKEIDAAIDAAIARGKE